jgi:hypothetical protein
MNKTILTLLVFISLLKLSFCFGYDLILKNGKIIKGTLISEDDSQIVLQDLTGVRMNFKKESVDLLKTAEANKPQVRTIPIDSSAKPAEKKPARKVTKEDLEKLKEKYDLGEGTFREEPKEYTKESDQKSQSKPNPTNAPTDSNWIVESEKLAREYRKDIKAMRDEQNDLLRRCIGDRFQGGSTYVDTQGNIIGYSSTDGEYSNPAACLQIYGVQKEIDDLKEQARTEGVPLQWMDEW